jgi:hypothetical protein
MGVLIREHGASLGEFMTRDPRGQKLPVYIAQLAEHLSMEQSGLLTQLESIKDNLQKITVMQQDYCKVAGEAAKAKGADSAPDGQREPEAATVV